LPLIAGSRQAPQKKKKKEKNWKLQFDMAAPHSPSMAPRYVPKRGQVMKKSLKKIFGLCFGNKSMISYSLSARVSF
jgi:hypothetical protein